MHVIWYIVIGFLAGLIARALLPGADHMGLLMTTLVGIVGSVVGGFAGHLFSKPSPDSKFHPAGFLMSIVGAIVVLVVLRFIR
ncbi:MAG: GlsB/YeaQ/YmgE family stress response membrane protein [Acidobacteria bacterium]|nr:GlsB/YeaQ/YmgE family stress response membrane protein [Acidobacteriota bacterium]